MIESERFFEAEEPMIILQFDNKYHHWALLMLKSLFHREPDVPVLADTINLSEEQVAELLRAHQNLNVQNDAQTWKETSPAMMAARKPQVMQNAMEENPGHPWYGIFDADMLVRRSLRPLWNLLNHQPLALFRTNGMWEGKYYRKLSIPSGIVLVRPEGRRLIDGWVKWTNHDQALDDVEPGEWFWDQVTLLEALEESRMPWTRIPLATYANNTWCHEAAIWSAHVSRGKDRCYEIFRKDHHERVTNHIVAE